MTSFFKRLLNPGGRAATEPGAARLSLAVFGKHPGWNDHIPGINVETETLAHVKQAVYVGGIGGCIDAGAWKSLAGEKRLEGFQHVLLWLRNGHVILGRMQSSEDGLHRKEYPLVLCLDSEGISPERILTRAMPELDRLLNACQATSSAEQVAAECRLAQERLHDVFLRTAAPGAPTLTLSTDVRRRFVEHPELGPDRVGLLRILHELSNVGSHGNPSQVDARPHHLRLPWAAEARDPALLLWAGFFQAALATGTSLLLLARDGTNWIDAIVGEPDSDDFFCLQATPAAQPLASQIPYELPPELRTRLQALEVAFLGTGGGAPAKPAATPESVPPPVPGAPPPGKGAGSWLLLIGLTVAILAVAGFWLMSGNRGSPGEANPPSPGAANPKPITSPPANETQPKPNPPPNPPATAAASKSAPPDEDLKSQTKTNRVAESKPVTDGTTSSRKTSVVTPGERVKVSTEDVELAQLALGRGNYDRAVEIVSKSPGDPRFKDLLIQLTAETNQLAQVTRALQAGDYPVILVRTNPLPDNPKFSELLAKAGAESRLLARSRADFSDGNYRFLQQPEVLALQTKPPYQQLLQAGRTEADLLKQAQTFRTGNQPQAAHDLLIQNHLIKAPFAEIGKWADAELEHKAVQTRDQQQAEALFQQGNYAPTLALCQKYAGVAAFDSIARKVQAEQEVLAAEQKRFAEGDYTYLNESAAGSYRSKPPFAELQRSGASERTMLEELQKLKQANDWRGAQTALAKLPAGASRKQPFAEIAQWSQAQAGADEQQKARSPAWLDAQLEVLLVRFNVLKPSDHWLQTEAARKEQVLEGALSLDTRNFYLNRVGWLRNEYSQRGWLKQREREKYLDRLESNIESR